MKRRAWRAGTLTGVCIVAASFGAVAQTPPAPPEESVAAKLSHGLQHVKDLGPMQRAAASTARARKQLSAEARTAIKRILGPPSHDSKIPAATRAAVAKILRFSDLSTVWRSMAERSDSDQMLSALFPVRNAIAASVVSMQQVLTAHVPAFAITDMSPGATGVQPIRSCNGGNDFYSDVTDAMLTNQSAVHTLAESIGRIERSYGPDIPALRGTAFVVDQRNGIVATACHVVDDIAAFDEGAGTWGFRKDQLGREPTILVDFGSGLVHDPQREFAVKAVAFVPSLEGCDGAFLQVDTSARALPPELTPAAQEPVAPINVFAIGYPGAPSSSDTPRTKQYFDCVHRATPDRAKFAFGGQGTRDELIANGYHILAHVIPTVGGQSGSPIFDATDFNHPKVLGVHICCVQSAVNPFGIRCLRRNENFAQEAISLVDMMRLYHARLALNGRGGNEKASAFAFRAAEILGQSLFGNMAAR